MTRYDPGSIGALAQQAPPAALPVLDALVQSRGGAPARVAREGYMPRDGGCPGGGLPGGLLGDGAADSSADEAEAEAEEAAILDRLYSEERA
eukprot:CAMPEP_0185367360 /NCGR_PEP_ID=MMETSP1364-20130426/14325_1 /TAXON_ID=38817 /ORGANISM="Gephyrocapsa oceanica, Strain RCC1303" /LENGTH=91 /DNA_ID=CAMNT_0027967997 /DNA_START=27 /DNA_END=298 /DNA_ORIENTATION=+